MNLVIPILIGILLGIVLSVIATHNGRSIRQAKPDADAISDCDQGDDVYCRTLAAKAEQVTVIPTGGKVIVTIGNKTYSGTSAADVAEQINTDDTCLYLAHVDKGKLEIADPGTGQYLNVEIA